MFQALGDLAAVDKFVNIQHHTAGTYAQLEMSTAPTRKRRLSVPQLLRLGSVLFRATLRSLTPSPCHCYCLGIMTTKTIKRMRRPPAAPTLRAKPKRGDFLPPDETAQSWERYVSGLELKQRRVVASQDAFLAAFAETGSVRTAAPAAGVLRSLVYYWQAHNLHRFKDRIDVAHHGFRERLQDIAIARIEEPQGNRGSDVLLLGTLNAHWPEKYRRDAMIVSNDASAQIWAQLTRLMADQVKQGITVTAPQTVEAQVRQVLGPGKPGESAESLDKS